MQITHLRNKLGTLGKSLKDKFKDLGVVATKDLSWGNHIFFKIRPE